ncbi:hypothetical protein DL770_002219 [Monosporascus sp. CRB-9-2]|nr:hypothetical protein DL770_002219 [Monosporascus sp. CRB-9-2]
MATVCLNNQVFYTPPAAAGPKLTSRSVLAGNRDLSTAISKAPLHPPPLQDAHDPRRGGPGQSPDDAVLISDGESDCDDSDDGRSDTTFPPLEELPTAPRNDVQSNSVAGPNKGVAAPPGASGDDDAKEPSVTGRADPDDKSASTRQQEARSLECSPAPSSVSPEALHVKQAQLVPAGYAAWTAGASPAEDMAKRHGHGLQHDPRPSAGSCGKTSNRDGTICLDNDEWDRRFPFSLEAIRRRSQARRANESARKAAGLDQPESVLDSHRQAQSPRSAASSHGVQTQQRSDSCRLSQHHDHRGDSDQTSDPEHHHPPVPDDRGEQNKEGSIVPPQAQESRASIPRLSDDESNNERKLANAEPSIQLSASQDRVNLQHNIGRRQHCDVDDGEDYCPVVGSDTEHSKDNDGARPPRRKRRRISTSAPTTGGAALKRQTRLHCTSSRSRQAQEPSQRPKRRRSQRSIPNPPSSEGATLGKESVKAPVAKFEEWPLDDVVLKRVTVDGMTTFQLQFGWHACTNHGYNLDRTPETLRRKSPAERTSSTGRDLPPKVASTAEVQDEYFQVEEILDSRR